MFIAIDGPAPSVKGTLGKRLAQHYGYRCLKTGVIYHAVATILLVATADMLSVNGVKVEIAGNRHYFFFEELSMEEIFPSMADIFPSI